MIQRHRGLSIAVSLAALGLVAACGPGAGTTPAAEKTDAATSAATNAAAETTNAVADTATNAAAPTNEVAANATAATNAAAAPAANAVAAAAPAAPAAGAVTLAVTDASGATLSGDPSKGAVTFKQCSTCHVVTPGVNKVGPSLAGIVGRAAGSVPGFRYSEANKNSGITWSEQELYVYLENPKAKIPGTTMAFVGIKDSQKRADLIAYLKSPS